MKKLILSLSAVLVMFTISCKDDDDDNNNNNVTDPCTLINGSVKWTIDGAEQCANTNIIADYAILMTINGIAKNGVTMTIELDSVESGTYEMKEDVNSIVYTDAMAMLWKTTDDNPGSITITKNDTSNNRFEATFSATLRNPLGISKNVTNGKINVFYSE